MTDAEIVRAVAEKVMGALPVPGYAFWRFPDGPLMSLEDAENCCSRERSFWPLTNDADTCAVLDKMVAEHEYCMVRRSKDGWNDGNPRWYCGFSDELGDDERLAGQAWHIDRRRAICLAALKAVGVDFDSTGDIDAPKKAQYTL
jgi:hypothetical protein